MTIKMAGEWTDSMRIQGRRSIDTMALEIEWKIKDKITLANLMRAPIKMIIWLPPVPPDLRNKDSFNLRNPSSPV